MKRSRITASLFRSIVLSIYFFIVIGLGTGFASSVPVPQWDKTFGGLKNDGLASLQQTKDGGFILGGISESETSNQKSSGNAGNADYWILKTDAAGNKIWDKTFGGTGLETFHTLQQTADGGYILGGSSQSGKSDSKSQPCLGNYDFWVIKIDAQGNKVWDKTLGGSGYDFLYSVQQTEDGGYIIGGVSSLKTVETENKGNSLEANYWVVKLNSNGTELWNKSFGKIDADAEEPFVMHVTPDNGFVLAGSINGAIEEKNNLVAKGASDFHLIKLNAQGNREWEKVYGGANDEFLSSLQPTADGGFVLGGISYSNKSGDKTQKAFGKGDYWVIKVNGKGDKVWDRTFGGNDYDYLAALQQTEDGGLLIGGISKTGSNGDKSQQLNGKTDYWVLKLDTNGNKVWEQAYGGAKEDELYALSQTLDGGFVLGGNSNSGNENGKTEEGLGGKDIWLVKIKAPVFSWHSR